MMASGFLLGFFNWIMLSRNKKRSIDFCSDLLFWVMISGILGARIAFVLANIEYYLTNPISILFIWKGGLIFYGGFIGAAVGILLFAKKHQENTLALYDMAITSVPLAHILGRIGCLMNGCCYGTMYNGPLSVTYPYDSTIGHFQYKAHLITHLATRTLPVHAVQLYESTANLALYILMVWVYKHRKYNGSVTALYLLAYPFMRYWLECFRGDERMTWMGTSLAQWLSIGLILLGIGFLWYSRKFGKIPNGSEKIDENK